MNYHDAVAWLYSTQLHGIRLGLETMRRLVEELGLTTGRATVFHVAGTNGKGSVCAMLDAICRAAGRRSGLFTSPHLVTFRERISVDGEMIAVATVADELTALRELTADWEFPPTFFELTTVLALRHFQRSGCEVIVLETGLGGRLDATNVVTPSVSVITSIGLDHQEWLGETIGEIAAEKAGIFKPEIPAVSAPQADEAAVVLRRHAEEVGALTLDFIDRPWTAGPLALAGSHQRWNAQLAIRALALSALGIHDDAIARGLREVHWPGRFQRLSERLILDGAHNPAAAVRLVETWREEFAGDPATLIIGILADKDVRTICAALLPIAARVIAVPVRSPRSSAPEEIIAIIRGLAPELPCETAPDLPTALDRVAHGHAPGADDPERGAQSAGRILICGSLFLVGEALAQDLPREFTAQ